MREPQKHNPTKPQSVKTFSRQPSSDQRKRVHPTTPASLTQANACAFSLIEVLFAVLILTMGMIFVSMQFPVGLANSRKQTEATLKIINSHNAKITMELQLGALVNGAVSIVTSSNTTGVSPDDDLIVADGNVHLLPKVNLLANVIATDRQVIVVDDPEDMLDLGTPQKYDNTSFNLALTPDFLPPFLTAEDNPSNPNLKLGNLGQLMSPAVTSSDFEVVDILNFQNGGNYDPSSDNPPNYPDMNAAIYDVALTRTYSWCALYKSIDQNTMRFYIFTLRKGTNAYAMQKDAIIVPPVVFPMQSDSEDRVYPVPWRVDLNAGSGSSGVGYDDRNYIGDPLIFSNNNPENSALSEFLLDATFTDLFQEGTLIIDADLENFPIATSWDDNGYIYEVMEVTPNGFLRLRKPLQDDLNLVWVVPPGYNRNSGEFAEVNPVVDVSEQVIRF